MQVLGDRIDSTSLLALSGLLRRNRARRNPREPSPAKSGTAVVVVTGLAGAAFVIENDPTFAGVALAADIASVTVVVAWLVCRFADRNAGEIREARSTPPERCFARIRLAKALELQSNYGVPDKVARRGAANSLAVEINNLTLR